VRVCKVWKITDETCYQHRTILSIKNIFNSKETIGVVCSVERELQLFEWFDEFYFIESIDLLNTSSLYLRPR